MRLGQPKHLAYFTGLIIMFTLQALADPVITSVSGTLTQGATVTIAGSGFGIKDPAPPLIWADFEDGTLNPSKFGQRKRWSGSMSHSHFALTTENQAPHSHFSALGTYTPEVRSFSFEIIKSREEGGWTKVYNYQKRFYDFGNTANQNFWSLQAGDSESTSFYGSWEPEVGRCYNTAEGYMGGVRGSYQGVPYDTDEWLTEEFIWQFEGGTGRNLDGTKGPGGTGIWDYTQNGKRVQHRDNVFNGTVHPTRLFTDNYVASAPPDGSKVYMDDIYIDDTYARVMIGNAPTLAGSTIREIQIPSSWSEASIRVRLNLGSFLDLDQAFLYVFDSNGAVNKKGYPLHLKSPHPAQ
jgi:hypothetical protein